MKRRLLSLALCLVTLLSLTPSVAHAEVLSGFTSKVDYDNTDPNRYSIEIDLVNQVITVYDQSGNAVLQSLCTTGSEKPLPAAAGSGWATSRSALATSWPTANTPNTGLR